MAEIDDTHAFHYSYLAGTELVGSIEYPSTTAATLTVSRTYNNVDESRLLLTQVSNSSDTATISRYGYAYDELGRRTSVVNEGNAFAVQPRHNSFDYNNRGEIIESGRFEGDDPSSPGTNVTAEARVYTFDNIGNRLTYAEAAQTPETTYTTSNLNQYTGTANPTEVFTYDDDGNLLTGSGLTYTYNGENRLVEVGPTSPGLGDRKITYSYDYMGRRVSRKVLTYTTYTTAWSTTTTEYTLFIWDGWQLVAELDGNNNNAVLTTYLWGLDLSGSLEGAGGVGGLLAARKKTGTPINVGFLYDGNGNVTQLVDLSDGGIVAKYEYDPFGKEIVATETLADWNKFRFSTKYLEDEAFDASEGSELDLYYYGYRYYSPRLGRWITRDPLHELGSTGYGGDISELLALEYIIKIIGTIPKELDQLASYLDSGCLYNFVKNSPAGLFDSDGRLIGTILVIGGISIAGAVCARSQHDLAHKRFGDSGDLFKHCWTSCRMSKICGGALTEMAGLGKEGLDSFKRLWRRVFGGEDYTGSGSWLDSLEDIIANQQCIGWESHFFGVVGGWAGSACRQSCEDCCRKKVGFNNWGHD